MSQEQSTTTKVEALSQTAMIVRGHEAPVVTRLSMETIQGFEALQRAAKLLAAASLVPERYRGQAGIPNAVIALEMAGRIGAAPLMVMQHLYVVHGQPAWSAQFLIAAVNSCGRFTALRYEAEGTPGKDGYKIRAWAIEKATEERLNGAWITWDMVKGEGWFDKNGSKWKTMPEQMGMYRAASFWQKAYAPEISMGLRTREEVEDFPAIDAEFVEDPEPSPTVATRPLLEDRIREQAAATKKTENAQEPPVPPAPAIPDSDQGMREMTDEEKDYQRSIAAQGPQSLPAAPQLKQRSIADEARARAQARRAAKPAEEE